MARPTARRFSSRITLMILVLAAVLAAGTTPSCRSGANSKKYRTQPVKRLTLESKVVANGTVNPVQTVLVGAQISGKIVEIFVDYNSEVRQGQVVARIDPSLFQAKVAQARSSLRQNRAEVQKARANLSLADVEHRRYESLWRQDLVSRTDYDKARTTYDTARAELAASQGREALAAEALKEAEINLGYTNITSPVNGVVVSRNVEVGQTVASTFQTPTLFTIAQDLTRMQVETAVDEAEVGRVALEQEATFKVDSFPDLTFTGRVTQSRLAPITVQNVVTYTVIVQADNPRLLLRPGMTATVTIQVARMEGVLAVPNAALRFQPGPEEAAPPPQGTVVWRLGPNGRPEPIPVTLGLTDGQWTEIKEGALQEGDQVIVGLDEAPGKVRPKAPPGLKGMM